jgi:non-homologous end joining protein Ku
MSPARPHWKSYLKLSLVSCPIALYTASSSTERVSFRQINKKTGNRLRQQLVDDITREPVEAHDKGRGYEYAKNAYMPAMNSTPLRSRATAPSKSTRSFRASKSTSDIWIARTISPRTIRPGRTHLR